MTVPANRRGKAKETEVFWEQTVQPELSVVLLCIITLALLLNSVFTQICTGRKTHFTLGYFLVSGILTLLKPLWTQ